MLLCDASLSELLHAYNSVVHDKLMDEQWLSRMPDECALDELREEISREFETLRAELQRRADFAHICTAFGAGIG